MEKIVYKKLMTRPMSLVGCEIWYLAEKVELPKLCGNLCFFDALFVYEKGKGVDVYYDFTSPNQDPVLMVEYFNRNKEKFFELCNEFDTEAEVLNNLSEKDVELKNLFGMLVRFFAKLVVILIVGNREDGSDGELAERAKKSREKYEAAIYRGEDELVRMLEGKKGFSRFITFSEWKEGKVGGEELEERGEGYIFFKGKVYGWSKERIAEEYDLVFGEWKNAEEMRGAGSNNGVVVGRARIVFELEDLEKIEDGEILVTPMTNPDYVPYLNRVKAIVTDQGGLLCHAAIVSREFGIPSIIGTQNATEKIKNGDVIEVDTKTGKVSIVSKVSF